MSSKINHHHHINGHNSITPPCPHLADFRSRNGTTPFHLLQNCLRIRPPHGRASIRRDPPELPRCASCGVSSVPRLYACVTCATISCHDPPEPSHAAAHAAAMAPGHEIAVDLDRAELFCCACRDYVYDSDFDASVVLSSKMNSNVNNSDSLRKRRRIVEFRQWVPDNRERVVVNNNSTSLVRDRPWGLRGLNNLGNTCFINSVLQALLHTPPLRNYFLSDRHNRYYCQLQKKSSNENGVVGGKRSNVAGSGDGNGAKKGLRRLCLACDMDVMFSAVFSGDPLPYSPAKFLYSWWQHAANLASYEQQDAHEFFISMLDGIHEKVEKDRHKPHSQGWGLRSLFYCPRS